MISKVSQLTSQTLPFLWFLLGISFHCRNLCMLQIQDLNLDNCRATQIEGLTDEFTNLTTLSLINVGLTTLKGFPNLPSLRKVRLLLITQLLPLYITQRLVVHTTVANSYLHGWLPILFTGNFQQSHGTKFSFHDLASKPLFVDCCFAAISTVSLHILCAPDLITVFCQK